MKTRIINTRRLHLILLVVLMGALPVSGQSRAVNRDKYKLHINQTGEKIKIDGLLDEPFWQTAEKADHFQRVTPTDTGYPISKTEVKLAYDETHIFLGAVCFDSIPGRRIVQSLRRDFAFPFNDSFAFFFDTYNDQTNGFGFYLSPAGVQYDHIGYDGSSTNISWDTKWKSAVKSYGDRWVIEVSLPFRSLRYFGGDSLWGVNFGRLDLKTNEKSAWAPMPRQITHCDLAYTGTLIWDKPLKKQGLGFSLIPYVIGKATKNNQPAEDIKWDGNVGFDAKIMLSTSLNLDVTVNPDYSQVEEDKQQTNLDRFELFYPERRQFFLENSDLFADLGNSSARPFFSRRIGLNVPVNAGIRLSGWMGDKWRIGIMDMQTGADNLVDDNPADDVPGSNFAVAVLQRKVFSRSSISGFFINKELTGDYNDTLYTGTKFNRVAGLEYNLASPDNKWTGKAFYHHSFYPGASSNASTIAGDLTYSTRYLKLSTASAWIGSDYIAEAGYIRRTGYFQVTPGFSYTFYPKSKSILTHGPNLSLDIITDKDFKKTTDRQASFRYSIGFKNRSSLTFSANESFVLLSRPYDPTNTGGQKLAAGESFDWVNGGFSYSSDSRKLFTYSMSANYGDYYNGTKMSLSGSLSYRFQPYGSLSVSTDYNEISLPDPYSDAKLLLVGPKLDVTFTDKLFFTTFVQYNNQIDNMNVNMRFQWRFAPVSDLFIVYTGNSNTDDFSNKNHGLVVKLSYWFN
jgi:hypothetical protein